MLTPLLLMIVAFATLGLALLLLRMDAARLEIKLRRLQIQNRGTKTAAF